MTNAKMEKTDTTEGKSFKICAWGRVFIITLTLLLSATLLFTGCAFLGNGGSPYEGKRSSDVSGYVGMKDIPESEVMYVDTTVEEIEKAMKNQDTFCFMASYADCPYCNLLMPYFNEAARRAGVKVGLLDTRKNPDWKNNADIDDYDTFCELFGNYLDKDSDGTPHLFTPDAYFIKNGEVVGNHSGVVEGADDPEDGLTEEQAEMLANILDNEFRSLE